MAGYFSLGFAQRKVTKRNATRCLRRHFVFEFIPAVPGETSLLLPTPGPAIHGRAFGLAGVTLSHSSKPSPLRFSAKVGFLDRPSLACLKTLRHPASPASAHGYSTLACDARPDGEDHQKPRQQQRQKPQQRQKRRSPPAFSPLSPCGRGPGRGVGSGVYRLALDAVFAGMTMVE